MEGRISEIGIPVALRVDLFQAFSLAIERLD